MPSSHDSEPLTLCDLSLDSSFVSLRTRYSAYPRAEPMPAVVNAHRDHILQKEKLSFQARVYLYSSKPQHTC